MQPVPAEFLTPSDTLIGSNRYSTVSLEAVFGVLKAVLIMERTLF
jgi:hypothetical protein